uniref:Alcohol dehydrogenase-like 2 n=1 Tax=Anthurium amnicola TaxID=1678845 RepID=A0A1D1Z1B1_9ARAE
MSTPQMSREASRTITCKAAVCWGPGEPLKVEEIQVEPPQASEVRVRLLYASTCHTDKLSWDGFPLALFPRVLGHEGVGVVESVGEGVTDFKEGDTVIPTLVGECKECPNCLSNRTNVCLKHPILSSGLMSDGTSRMSVGGHKLYHLFCCSTFSEYTVVDVKYAIKVDTRLPPQHASLLSCGFSTGFGAVWKEAKFVEGSTVAVFGLGGVGMGAIIAAKSFGAAKIIGVDLKDSRRAKGTEFGMTDFINPKELDGKTTPAAIKEMTGGLGVDYSFECSGVAPLINEAFEATTPGKGVTIVVGASQERTTPINLLELILGKTLKGSLYGGIKTKTDIPILVAKCVNKELLLDGLLTHEVELNDINRAYELLKQPECLKVLIKFNGVEE